MSGPINILVVDDDQAKLLTIEAVLADLKQNVVCATSGREALRQLLRQDFAVILLDINMPDMDGFETARLIRQRKNSENTPIIFITAYGDELLVERGYSLGAVDYILTPIVPDVLRTKVSVFVELYRQTEQIRRQARRLEQRTQDLSALANQLTAAEHRERARLAQILHDHLQQLLVAAKMRIGSVRGAEGDEKVRLVRSVDQLLDDSIGLSRSLAVELSPPILHDGGLDKALHWMAGRCAADHGLRVKVGTTDDCRNLPEHIAAFLYQASRELLFNVVKHAGVDEAQLHLQRTQGLLRLTVEDRGAGFEGAADDLRPGADHFGLFSIRERLAFLNGSLDIESEPGAGTRITMSVPAPDAPRCSTAPQSEANTATAAIPPSAAAAHHGNGAIRVLLVDDHEMLRKGLASVLEADAAVHVIGEAGDGEQAVRLARELNPDVIIMDLSMPRMNGVEATRRITAERSGTRIIGLSMHDSDEMAATLLEAGAVGYLNKAGPPEQLLTLIHQVHARPPAHASA